MITIAERARALFHIDTSNGRMFWSVEHGRWGAKPAGSPAGCLRKGYRYVFFAGKNMFAHHIAWLMAHGEFPSSTLDHINGNRDDNRPSNLRIASAAQNNQNQHGLHAHNTSGLRGVSWDKSRQKWLASISVGDRRKNLGRFSTRDEASMAYRTARKQYHPFSSEAAQ